MVTSVNEMTKSPAVLRGNLRPLFSIVTVCLNAGERLSKTIESIIRQSSSDYELIVKDGVSRDGSLQAIPKDKHILVVSMPDGGIYDAMNQALAYCRGEYILFLNAGDYLHSSKVLEELAMFLLGSNSSPDVILMDFVRQQSQAIARYPERFSRFFLYRKCMCHQSVLAKRELFTRYGNFQVRFVLLADKELLLRFLVRYRVTYESIRCVGIVYEGGGISESPALRGKLLQELSEIQKSYFPRWECALYSLLGSLTLQGLRSRYIPKARGNAIGRVYNAIANRVDRL